MAYALIPVQDVVELCEFDGTFEEGEGMSMGQPIVWKNPKNAKCLRKVAILSDYDKYPDRVIKNVFQANPDMDKLYVDGVQGWTGWHERGDFISTESFVADEDMQARCKICGAMKSRIQHPTYWRYWGMKNTNAPAHKHIWLRDD